MDSKHTRKLPFTKRDQEPRSRTPINSKNPADPMNYGASYDKQRSRGNTNDTINPKHSNSIRSTSSKKVHTPHEQPPLNEFDRPDSKKSSTTQTAKSQDVTQAGLFDNTRTISKLMKRTSPPSKLNNTSGSDFKSYPSDIHTGPPVSNGPYSKSNSLSKQPFSPPYGTTKNSEGKIDSVYKPIMRHQSNEDTIDKSFSLSNPALNAKLHREKSNLTPYAVDPDTSNISRTLKQGTTSSDVPKNTRMHDGTSANSTKYCPSFSTSNSEEPMNVSNIRNQPISSKTYIYCSDNTSTNSANYKLERTTSTAEVLRPTRGLKNLGNTCFMNCILQCLSHTLPLRQFFVSDDYKRYLKNKGDLSYAFKCVMTELWKCSKDSYAPYELKNQVGRVAPRFSGYNQHDAQEFMRFLLNEVHDEINKANVKGRKSPKDDENLKEACARYLTWEDSKISELFGGMLRSEVCCCVCRTKSIVYDPFMDLALPIPRTKSRSYQSPSYSFSYDNSTDAAVKLPACLQVFTREETLDEDERPYCNKCKKMTTSTKQLTIAKLPSFLVIQLKRFSGYSVRSKLSTPVEFEERWQIEDSVYSLYAIACHAGGIYGGHYTAYCKYDKQWRCFNDNYAITASWEQVKRQEAYILFYEKTNDS